MRLILTDDLFYIDSMVSIFTWAFVYVYFNVLLISNVCISI
jgi:hypothetical protein